MAVGETILGAVLEVVFDKLASRQVIEFFRSSKLDESLVDKLKSLMSAVAKLLSDAEQKQITDRAVKSWLSDLKHLFYRAEEIVNEITTEANRSSMGLAPEPESFQTKVRNFIPAFSNSSSFAKIVTSNILEVVTRLDHMLSQKGALGLQEGFSGKVSQRLPTTCLVEDSEVYGRDQEKEQLIELLLSEEVGRQNIGVVAVVGMGGLGKTTLAKMVYSDVRLNESFDLKIWVYVSDQFDISRITKSILESITSPSNPSSLDLNLLHIELSGKLREKRFLLVLDDVWNERYEDWERLRAPLNVGAYGSKIIVTTRKDGVASMMRTTPTLHLKPLSDNDGWSLFSKHAFEIGNSNPGLEALGRKIIHKCQGLPLAIKTLGGLLRCKQEICEWEAILESSLWDLPEEKSNVIPALRLSYNHLPSHLKRCFSYSAIFPKGYWIDRSKLVLMWMAENFVQPTDNGRRLEDIGNEYLCQLSSSSFFEPRGIFITVHDLMHDLAQAVAGEFFARLEHDNMPKISERVRHFSYFRDRFDGYTKFEALHATKFLRTIMPLQSWASQTKFGKNLVQHRHEVRSPEFRLPLETWRSDCYLSNQVPAVMIPQFYLLQVLSLAKYKILKLPDSIGNLKQLRYLDVSETGIEQLPESVSTLNNLQTLLLSCCDRLQILPSNIGRLVFLRHLDIFGTASLKEMPIQMGKLKNLQTLTSFVVGKNSGSGIQELKDLSHIRGKIALRRLQNVIDPDDALEANMSGRDYLDELAFEFDDNDSDDSQKERAVLENLKPNKNLRRLSITSYAGTSFPSWLDNQYSVYTNMRFLCLTGCQYCYSLPPLGQLPSLTWLEIKGMDGLEALGAEFCGHNTTLRSPFPCLDTLIFKDMKNWKVWSTYVEGGELPFPCLQSLFLNKCPKLKGNLPVHAPSLKELHIEGCEQLAGSLMQLPSKHCLPPTALGSAFHLTSITFLSLEGLVDLVTLPPEVGMLLQMETLAIHNCKNLKSLENMGLPSKLASLHIVKCELLESLPEVMVALTHLRHLFILHCPCLKSAQEDDLPTSLQSLEVCYSQSWMFSIPMERMHQYTSLEVLSIEDIGGPLVSFPLGVFPNLRSLSIRSCNDLENLCIPRETDLNNLMSLQELIVIKCPKLNLVGVAAAGVIELPAPNLINLEIIYCKNALPLLGDGKGLPSTLASLSIDYFNKITSWTAKSFLRFSSLRELRIHSHHVECFPDNGSLPTSLSKLSISRFPNLKFIHGQALKSLTSLQELCIWDCRKLQCLPEDGLPLSLGCLDVRRCSLLEERCQRGKGKDWTKIHHLPCVKINGKLI